MAVPVSLVGLFKLAYWETYERFLDPSVDFLRRSPASRLGYPPKVVYNRSSLSPIRKDLAG
jgi:hypothetical protein